MAVSLIKKDFLPLKTAVPMPVLTDTLPHHQEIECPLCPQRYILGHSDGEQNRLGRWLATAKGIIRGSHRDGHKLMSLVMPGIPS